MSKLDKFLAKPIKCVLGDEEIEIYPLTFGDLDIVVRLDNPETSGQAIKELLVKTLKKTFSDSTDEEILNMKVEYLEPVFQAIMKANDLEMSDAKKQLMDKIKKE